MLRRLERAKKVDNGGSGQQCEAGHLLGRGQEEAVRSCSFTGKEKTRTRQPWNTVFSSTACSSQVPAHATEWRQQRRQQRQRQQQQRQKQQQQPLAWSPRRPSGPARVSFRGCTCGTCRSASSLATPAAARKASGASVGAQHSAGWQLSLPYGRPQDNGQEMCSPLMQTQRKTCAPIM